MAIDWTQTKLTDHIKSVKIILEYKKKQAKK